MGAEKAILSVIPIVQSAQLIKGFSKSRKKRLIGSAMDAFIGIPLIQVESQLINDF